MTQRLVTLGLGLLLGWQGARAQTNALTVSLDNNGTLAWNAVSNSAGYVVLWAPTVAGPWSAWNSAPGIIPTGTVTRIAVPMFYRVASLEYTNTLLIHGQGLPWSSVPVDGCGHSASAVGGAQISTNAGRFGGSSIGFDGTSSLLSVTASSVWAFGTGDFTVDFWANFSSASTNCHLVGTHSKGVGADWVFVYTPTSIGFYINDLPCVLRTGCQ